MLRETTDLETPLTKALREIGFYITIAISVIAVLMLVIGTWRAVTETEVSLLTGFRETLIFAIALAVGAIPEGLPAVVTIALAIGVQRMAARKAIVRKLPAVETLGSTTVICSDKTGTLTRNEMTVQALWTAEGTFELSGVGYEPRGELLKVGQPGSTSSREPSRELIELITAGALCNDSNLVREGERWTISGDPTEGALVVAAEKLGISVTKLRAEFPRQDAIPFESENQYMATLQNGELLIKGAPEVVIKRCATLRSGAVLNPEVVLDQVHKFGAQGMRVLAFARKTFAGLDVTHADAEGGFEFLGLQGMIDPPRQEALEAIKKCHAARIVVKMITGDHKATAQAIGKELNLGSEGVAGGELSAASDEQLKGLAVNNNVFARVAPEHKLKLVQALQAQDQVVAMTGDGVNDAPALKQANIGVAMGITGTSVSKEAAAIVLTDDNFASIAAAVEEGRRVYDNLIKSLAFILPTNLGLAMILIAAVAFFPFVPSPDLIEGMSLAAKELLLPLSPPQLLWINLVAAVALALPLAFEAKEPNVMRRPPRSVNSPVLSGFVIARTFAVALLMTVGCIGLFFYELDAGRNSGLSEGAAISKAQTMAVTTVIMFQIFYLLNCRSLRDSLLKIGVFSNPAVFLGIGSLILLQLFFIYAPVMNGIFSSAPLSLSDLLLATLVGAAVLPVISVEKWYRNRA
jgi:Ca2+-transporting ATPase